MTHIWTSKHEIPSYSRLNTQLNKLQEADKAVYNIDIPLITCFYSKLCFMVVYSTLNILDVFDKVGVAQLMQPSNISLQIQSS